MKEFGLSEEKIKQLEQFEKDFEKFHGFSIRELWRYGKNKNLKSLGIRIKGLKKHEV